jgi:2-oxoglutarate dehydrogenase E1 component
VLQLYTDQLAGMKSPVLSVEQMKAIRADVMAKYRAGWERAEKKTFNYKQYQRDAVLTRWKPYVFNDWTDAEMHATNVTAEDLAPVVAALESLPEGFEVHRTLKGIFEKRKLALNSGVGLEWGHAEALALGTLLNKEKFVVRVSGQDAERATFSQRHAVVHDQATDSIHIPLANISKEQGHLTITNSALSEYGVLGFEVGYALRDPDNFVMWEAQYGDFANGAQIMFDQFFFASMAKWRQPCSTVVSMPHGHDGGGPEHSSGRIERFMQAAMEDETTPEMPLLQRHWRCNVCVVHPTTPAQYFHALRRHMKRNFRRPLAIFFSKATLRAPYTSNIEELTQGHFSVVLPDVNANAVKPADTRRVLFCYGQLYYQLEKERSKRAANDVAIVRLEELSPMPLMEMREQVEKYANAEVVWCQEEPKNMGPWPFVEPHLERMAANSNGAGRPNKGAVRYVGRELSPSVATGFKSIHDAQNEMINEAAFRA